VMTAMTECCHFTFGCGEGALGRRGCDDLVVDQDNESPGPKRFLNQEARRRGGLGAGGLSTTAGKDVGGA